MIDCMENQARGQAATMHHLHQHQHQQASATYRPLQHQSSKLLDVVPQTTNVNNSSNGNGNGNGNSNSSNNNNELIGYYFGSISRETADWILRNHGNQLDGAYLLRSSGPNDDFVLSLMVVTTMPNNSSITCQQQQQQLLLNSSGTSTAAAVNQPVSQHVEVLHYKIVETEDSFVALHGQIGDEKFATIDELIDKAQGVATKPRWPIHRLALESQILPPTYWGLTVYQVCLAFFIKAKQWGFPLLPSLFQQPLQHQQQQQQQQQQQSSTSEQQVSIEGEPVTTLSIETMRTLIYKSLHEFQPWFHGKISREDAERRIEDGPTRDGKFLVRERDTYSYAMCICHRRATKHYRIDVLPTGELAIQDGRKFTSLMALVSHYTIMSDGLWCALTEPCPRPIQPSQPVPPSNLDLTWPQQQRQLRSLQYANLSGKNLYCVPPALSLGANMTPGQQQQANLNMMAPSMINYSLNSSEASNLNNNLSSSSSSSNNRNSLACAHPIGLGGVTAIKAPIKEWLQTINQKWTQLMAAKNQHQSLNSFLFGSQNPLNNHCRHGRSRHHHHHHHHNNNHNSKQQHSEHRRGHSSSCGCIQQHHAMVAKNSTGQIATLRQPLDHNRHQYHHHNNSNNQDLRSTQPVCNRTLTCPPGGKFVAPSQFLAADQALNSSLLNCLPQNSGFQLNGQSFIGSALFAVRSNGKPANPGSSGDSSSSSNNGSNIVEQEEQEIKLISPAQSISANLDQQQPAVYSNHMNNDLYGGSQPSTAIVNDKHMMTSSSSSSGTITHLQNQISNATSNSKFIKRPDLLLHKRQTPNVVQTGGHILCGQHAGPAYRYTNCQNDENSFRPCSHRPHQNDSHNNRDRTTVTIPARAFTDDSQLHLESGRSQLPGQAALSKFVQFQDGQCLRTHRDTRSIQMAYLSSQRQMAAAAAQTNNRQHQNLPFKVLNSNQNLLLPNTAGSRTLRSGLQPDLGGIIQTLNEHRPLFVNESIGNNSSVAQNELDIDLMDCSSDRSSGNHFKVDPKLIKSSSIETLCGATDDDYDEELLDNVLSNCKSNAELLQACFQVNSVDLNSSTFPSYYDPSHIAMINNKTRQPDDILKPIQIHKSNQDDVDDMINKYLSDKEGSSTFCTTTHLAGKDNSEKLDYLNKKHDLDELYTALFAELDASLKAQVDLKNKCLGFGLTNSSGKQAELAPNPVEQSSRSVGMESLHETTNIAESNPSELIYEFDSLISSNSNHNSGSQ